MKVIKYRPKRLTRKEVDYIVRTICNQTSALESQRDISKIFGLSHAKHAEKAIERFDRAITILTQVEIIE